jgi:hypothetical protein
MQGESKSVCMCARACVRVSLHAIAGGGRDKLCFLLMEISTCVEVCVWARILARNRVEGTLCEWTRH